MLELYQQSIAAYTLPVTLVLLLCLVYWVFVILGALDIDALDFGSVTDATDLEVNLDSDVDVDVDSTPTGVGGIWSGLMDFFNLVEVPAMIFLSILSLSMWLLQVNLNSMFNVAGGAATGFGLLVCSLIAGLFIAKAVTQPMRPLFKRLNEGEEMIQVIGQEGIVKSTQVDGEYGQVEVLKSGAPLLVNARTAEGAEPIPHGESVLIFREDKEKGIYIVRTL